MRVLARVSVFEENLGSSFLQRLATLNVHFSLRCRALEEEVDDGDEHVRQEPCAHVVPKDAPLTLHQIALPWLNLGGPSLGFKLCIALLYHCNAQLHQTKRSAKLI